MAIGNISNMGLDETGNQGIPSSPEDAYQSMVNAYKDAELQTLKREMASLIHKLIQDAIKKIGQAA